MAGRGWRCRQNVEVAVGHGRDQRFAYALAWFSGFPASLNLKEEQRESEHEIRKKGKKKKKGTTVVRLVGGEEARRRMRRAKKRGVAGRCYRKGNRAGRSG